MLFDSSDTQHANMSRYQKKDIVACNELAKGCIEYIENNFDISPIHFSTELADSATIKSNELYLVRTIRELLYNAAKFSDGQYISLHIAQTENYVRIIIEDVGPGLPKNSEEFVFIPFTKVDDLADGLGLGLPLCKGHMTALGGDIIHDSSYDKGCRIIVEIPKE